MEKRLTKIEKYTLNIGKKWKQAANFEETT